MKYKHYFLQKRNQIIINLCFYLILLAKIAISRCDSSCSSDTYLSDTTCFNNVINFDHLNYRSGHFASKKNGDLVIEYSGNPPIEKRLFYGLKENGRGLFNDGYIREKDLPGDYGRYESRNLFISLKEDTNREKEYLFSTSSYKSLTELHDLENDEIVTRYSDDFNEKRIFSFAYSLFKTNLDNYNFLIFTSPNNDNDPEAEDGSLVVIKKFAITNFGLNTYENNKKTFTKFGDRVISGFIMEEVKVLVILYLKRSTNDGKIKGQYNIRFYDYNLNQIGNDLNNYENKLEHPNDIQEQEGLYANCIYLKNKIGLFIYFYKGRLIFQCFEFYLDNGNYKKNDVFFNEFGSDKGFDSSFTLNDVHKINENRIGVITTKSSGTILYIILLDFYGSYVKRKFRLYHYKLFSGYRLNKELALYSYKDDFLVFSSTKSPNNNDKPYTSFLLFFNYPNGTDFQIDISPYLQNSKNYDSTKNLFEYLMSKMTIENNIFRYKKVQKIKLVSIPNEISFYNPNDNKLIQNGDYLYTNYILKQNIDLQKTDELYHLYYQYIAEEPSYNELYYSGLEILDDTDYSSSYTAKEVSGRTNKLSFKLCHDYCETCFIISKDNDHQNCTSCLTEYTFDYLAYTNNFTGNCVPEGQMYDKEEQKLLTCEGNDYKYYYNTSRHNKKYCFKSLYECPDVYHYLNTSTNECINYTDPIITILAQTPTIQEATSTFPKLPTEITQIPTKIPTIPTTITKEETTIITTIPKKMTNMITSISTIIYNCNYYTVYTECIFTNLTNEEIYNKLKKDILSTYPTNGISINLNGSNGYTFELTNTFNDNNTINRESDISVIDLGKCEATLRNIYHIDDEFSIIILKYLNVDNRDKFFDYELYHPTTYEKLNLSYCINDTYDLYIPLDLEESFLKEYSNGKNQGHDLFNSEDSFYKKMCIRYTSDSGTDVILDDRMSFYYNKVVNYTTCPENCKYISYSIETEYLKCECGINNNDISTFDFNHIIGKNTYKSFYSTLRYSNYKVMRCYNLVFNFEIFCHNAGSILNLILLVIYIIFIFLYILKDIAPLKIYISKLLFKNNSLESNINQIIQNDKTNKIDKNKTKSKNNLLNDKSKNKKINIKYPPKKKSIKLEKDISNKNKSNEKLVLINSFSKRKNEKNLTNNLMTKNIRKKDKKMTKDVKKLNNNNLEIFQIKNKNKRNNSIIKNEIQSANKLSLKTSNTYLKIKDKILENKSLNLEDYDNFELNNLDYIPACEIDKRSFCRTYWSVLLREHIALITFFAWNDYNLFYVKFDRFIIQFSTNMAMNGLFFSDESMHNLYANNGDDDFVQQIPQMLYSLIIGHILEVILCYFSLTDTSIYNIKELSKNKENGLKIIQEIKCMKIKLIIFFVFTFILFLFYWYFISAFCAVYPNTQTIFIRDSFTSFITSMIDPFLIYLLTNILRAISLSKCCKKKAGLIYNISQFLPIF